MRIDWLSGSKACFAAFLIYGGICKGGAQTSTAGTQGNTSNAANAVGPDPYRWMEKVSGSEMQNFITKQNEGTRLALQQFSSTRRRFLERILELLSDSEEIGSVKRILDRYFFLRASSKDKTECLAVRDVNGGESRTVFDPATLAPNGTHAAIDYFLPSWDGEYVIVGVSLGGSEKSVLRIVETVHGTLLPDSITRTEYAMPCWEKDSRSFYYARQQPLMEGDPPSATYENERVYYHKLGADPDGDEAVFGPGLLSASGVPKSGFSMVQSSFDSDVLIAAHSRGTIETPSLWALDLRMKPRIWKQIASTDDLIVSFALHGTELYAISKKAAPKGRVICFDVLKQTLSEANEVCSESSLILTSAQRSGLRLSSDGIYVYGIRDGKGIIRRIPFPNTSASSDIDLPFTGSIFDPNTDVRRSGITFSEESWTHPELEYRYDPNKHESIDTELIRANSANFLDIASLELEAVSSDGTRIPISIIEQKGLPLNSSHPTVLDVYGAYGVPIMPKFQPELLAWLENGGIVAYGHVRGGGEKGEEWHLGGMLSMKQHTIDDTIACGQFLIDQRYSSKAHLALEGASAGGIAVGGAIVQRPDLFSAAVIRSGLLDLLGFAESSGGEANVPEFGSTRTQQGLISICAISPYSNVKERTSYPAVFLEAGLNDKRVPVWQSAKMAARLQSATSSNRPILLRVDYDVGHYGASTIQERADALADEYTFLEWQLGQKVPIREQPDKASHDK